MWNKFLARIDFEMHVASEIKTATCSLVLCSSWETKFASEMQTFLFENMHYTHFYLLDLTQSNWSRCIGRHMRKTMNKLAVARKIKTHRNQKCLSSVREENRDRSSEISSNWVHFDYPFRSVGLSHV